KLGVVSGRFCRTTQAAEQIVVHSFPLVSWCFLGRLDAVVGQHGLNDGGTFGAGLNRLADQGAQHFVFKTTLCVFGLGCFGLGFSIGFCLGFGLSFCLGFGLSFCFGFGRSSFLFSSGRCLFGSRFRFGLGVYLGFHRLDRRLGQCQLCQGAGLFFV